MSNTFKTYDLFIFSRLKVDSRLAKRKIELLARYCQLNGFELLKINVKSNEILNGKSKR